MSPENGENQVIKLDALIVGAGFGGVYQLKRLRDRGFSVKLVEAGKDFGGVWYWNRYPGARVDSPIPHYEYSDPELWADWTWSQRFPGSAELRAYFAYVAEKWNLHTDCMFGMLVTSASWNDRESKWVISLSDGRTVETRYFLPNTGFAAKRYVPEWPGIDSFTGTIFHPSYWPSKEVDLRGKKIAVVGTGSTGVQLMQALAPDAAELVLFQRTPNLGLPMGQIEYSDRSPTTQPKDRYAELFAQRYHHFGGFDYNFAPIATFEHTPEQRKAFYESLWSQGDFHFWLGTYYDMLFDDDSNTEAYNFWRDKTRARIRDPQMRDKLAPMTKPHAFGCKRISLENGYFELFDLPQVKLVDVNETPVVRITAKGVETSEKEYGFDVIICATGFDAITGGILGMNIKGKDGLALKECWENGIKTYMGISVPDFPNMFFTYGPQAPTALCNGPTCAELQGDWIVELLDHMEKDDKQSINASRDKSRQWAETVAAIANSSLLPTTKSWYMGDNIPGKRREPLIYLGGVSTYYKTLLDCAANDYEGYSLS